MSRSEADHIEYRGTNEGSKMAGNASLWENNLLENNSSFGEIGLSALPSGFRDSEEGYDGMGIIALFWSSTEVNSSRAWYRLLAYGWSEVYRNHTNLCCGFSVRCVRD